MPHNAIAVFTARGPDRILREGGTQAWVLDPKRARLCEFAVCTQNRGFKDDWGYATEPHHAAFLIGRISEVVPSPERNEDGRWLIRFSEYARVQIPDVWPGARNPVWYTTLEELGIDPASLTFEPMPEVEAVPAGEAAEANQEEGQEPALTIPEAKRRLALTLGVDPSNIKIIVEA